MTTKHPTHASGKLVNVLQSDINRAVRNNSTHCAVAEAVARELDVSHVLVDIQTIRYSDHDTDKRYIYLTPPAVQEYIISFDAGDNIAPFTFALPGTPAYTGQRKHRHDEEHKINYRSHVRAPVYVAGKRDSTTRRSVPVDGPPRAHTSSASRAYGIRRLRINRPTTVPAVESAE